MTEIKKLDVRGAKCPIPIVKAKKMVDTMSPGEIVEVLATDPGSVADFKGWAKIAKHAALKEQRTEKDETGREVFVHVVERTT
jgi:TusA-related sulfurtransferase